MAYGDGALRQLPSGKWQVRYYGPDRQQHSKSFTRKADALDFRREVLVDRKRGAWIDPRDTQTRLGDWIGTWLSGRHRLEPSSRATELSLIRTHILPRFGHTAIGRITPTEVRKWVNDLVDSGLSARTVHAVYGKFTSIMKAAVAARLVALAPIGKGVVDLPPKQRKPERFLTPAEVDALVECVSPHYRAFVMTAAYTGLRWQELAGLYRSNLDLLRAELTVSSVVQRVGGSVRVVDWPKSESGRRRISIPSTIVGVLAHHLEEAPPSDFVFPGPQGAVLRHSNFRKRQWLPAVQAAFDSDLCLCEHPSECGKRHDPIIDFHDLRHTHVAWLVDAGVQEYKIVRRMGWKDGRMLHTTYGHLFNHAYDELMVDLDERFESAKTSSSREAPVVQIVASRG